MLARERLERLAGWGESVSSAAFVYRPINADGIRDVFQEARQAGRYIGLRGAGRSYGDAALCAENGCLDLTRMNRILDWNPETGLLQVEAGVTIRQIWQYVLGDGWWPTVVSGTMHPTAGGAAAMNIHGKNHFHAGTWGDNLTTFDLLLPSGEEITCDRKQNADLFYAAIGGFGMLGVITRMTLQMKRVHSGLLKITPIPIGNWREMFAAFDMRTGQADYLVSWIDAFATGAKAGRGQIQQANYLAAGDDPAPAQTLRVAYQELPDTLFGIVPKSLLWRFMRPLVNDTGIRAANRAKSFLAARDTKTQTVPHTAFHFMLDYVPEWKRAYGAGGLMQYQTFVPKEHAESVFAEQIARCQRRGLVPYLAVLKRHRPDPFLMSYAGDGYSLALDFRMTDSRHADLFALAAELDREVIAAGGRFYFAKDSTLHHSRLTSFLAEQRVQTFLALKQKHDPENLLQTDLFRRLFLPINV